MSGTVILTIVSYFIAGVILIIVTLSLFKKHKKEQFAADLNNLERDKNLIISASILSELNKVENLINNEILKNMYEDWLFRFKEIKDKEVPKITDELLELEDFLVFKKEEEITKKIAHIEMEICFVKTKARYLLNEIREITLSEERNREHVTKLKALYREVINKYKKNYDDYKEVQGPLELQFENIDKLFSAFEMAMESNSYTEVGKIVKAMGDTIGNIKVVVEEAPPIILMGKSIIPRKMEDISSIYEKMTKEGFILEYLNIPYNVDEANKKIQDIFSRLNVLNVEDSIFELKTILDYFDSLYNDFDKEKISKKLFDEYTRTLTIKISRLTKIARGLYNKIEDIKYSYDLTEEDVKVIDEINKDLVDIEKDFEVIINAHRSKLFAYTKLTKEMELVNVKITKIEERLEVALRTLGSLKDDELRAREQLDEIKNILKNAKTRINSFKLPVIPKNFYIELTEATEAIKEIVKELDRKPISIKILNIRVDTARDLVLKLYNTTVDTIKTASMAEMAIIYGNRYRPINRDLALGLSKAEGLFFKGSFKSALENAINALNIIEPGVHKRLKDVYPK